MSSFQLWPEPHLRVTRWALLTGWILLIARLLLPGLDQALARIPGLQSRVDQAAGGEDSDGGQFRKGRRLARLGEGARITGRHPFRPDGPSPPA
jgi:hypothetical protein